MVTGDHPQTALAIARQIGLIRLPKPVILTGEELSRLSLTQLQLALDAQEILFARLAADQKMGIVDALKRKHEIVAVTGDGVNDAPALKRADIGIAMGQCGTDVAREVADMILLDDNFASIVSAIEEGRAVFANIRKFLSTARQERTSLSAGHHRLLERHHRFASCQCAYLSVQLEFGV
jgi:sodium/potassium-transporting ATPase subunit alpha